MKKTRVVCVLIAVLLLAVSMPMVLAEELAAAVNEKASLGLLDRVWRELDEVESEALASGADADEVTRAVLAAVLENELTDENSVEALTEKGFRFRVHGMLCCYDYPTRNSEHVSAVSGELLRTITEAAGARNGSPDMNVLLIGPFYGQDANFTNQYPNEAASIAEATGGSCTILSAADATGPAIAAAFPDAGVVLLDSHGADG
ncbi:MAG: hypothetical protein II724_00950, partial [Clostridia bacterium]|nr:hypothetical protein [Clostridia bacterium]